MSPTAAERGREVRRKLLDAAVALISERGWGAVSTRVVAERAGVAPGLVHYHFSSVQALLSEAAVGAMREVGAVLEPALARAGTPAEAMAALASALDPYTGDDPTSLLFTETYLAATRDPALRAAVAEVIVDFRARLAAWLGAHGVAAPEATAAVVGAAVDGLVLQRALDPGLTSAAITPVLTRLMGGQ
ncbi:TetR/AcrR family transcriptional regulator [Actinophytocola sp. NPDC049390]|uniref:TetR/AcrR family transcriptional regulator n=1 Tax=Actinophytocola sp. NPDC049390 TaxID=3363894 RepID=UPI0037A6ED25